MQRKLLLIFVVSMLALLAFAASALAHVPPDTGAGGQDGCVSETHDPADVADGGAQNNCGTAATG